MRPKLLLAILLLLTTFATAGSVSGKWNGTLEFKGEDGQTQTVPAHADLRQQNNTIAGTIWKEDSERFDIEQGGVTGNEIYFTFRAPEGEKEQIVAHSVKLTLGNPSQMHGTLRFDAGGQTFTGKLTLTLEK